MGRKKKARKDDYKIGDPVLYHDRHGKHHAGIIFVLDVNDYASIVFCGHRGAVVEAHSVPRDKPARRGDYWE